MKKIMILLFSLLLVVALASSTFATPILTDADRYSFYVNLDSFQKGTIDNHELGERNGWGMGMILPVYQGYTFGLRFGSSDYSQDYFECQAAMMKKDIYLYRLNYTQLGDDGSITHLGVYRQSSSSDAFSLFLGGGLSFITITNEKTSNYTTLFLEVQGRFMIGDDAYTYLGGSYDYHLGAGNLEAGIGMLL